MRIGRIEHVHPAAGVNTADRILRAVAEQLVAVLPADGEVARVGEGSFLVMLPVPRSRPLKVVEVAAEQQIAGLRLIANLPAELSVAVGIAVSAGSSTAAELLQQVDVAVTAAEQGKRAVQVYRPELLDRVVQRARTVRLLTAAVDRDELELHYQPVMETAGLTRVGVEALVRWRHHGRLHPPAEWIPIAEEQGLMPAIGLRVLQIAIRDQAVLGCPVAINVSPQQLVDRDFAADVLRVLGDCPPAAITLEITENCFITSPDTAQLSLDILRAQGIRVAVDDFGTGYSSLSRLAAMPCDILKIDRSFVNRVLSTEGRTMVTAIHAMARALGKITVAEGVETTEQLQALTEIGCDRVQGFLCGRPAALSASVAASELRLPR